MTSSQNFESYIPVYDAIPEKWEDAKPFIVEQFKAVCNAINVREIGWFLDEELLSGQQFIPISLAPGDSTPQQYRSIFRKVVDFSPLAIGLNSKPHGISITSRFSLMQLYAAATDSLLLTSAPFPNGAGNTMSVDAININITSTTAYDRCWAVITYIQEV